MSYTFLLIFYFITITTQLERTNVETKLVKHITTKTSKYIRPVVNESNSVILRFGFELVQLVSVSEQEQSMQMKLWLRMKWKNEFLTWDKEKYENLSETRLDSGLVWTPDIYAMEDVGEELSQRLDKYKTVVLCQHDGTNQWHIPVINVASCHFDATNFPYDKQTCNLTYVLYTYTGKAVDLEIDPRPITTNYLVESPEWIIKNTSVNRVVKYYSCCPEPYVQLTYTVQIVRRAQYYFFTSIAPCVIQMLIILSTFFLPPDSGERIGVVITVLLVFAVYLQVLSSHLPKTSKVIPALSLFFVWSMATSSCSLIATSIVLVIHFRATEKGIKKMPDWVSHLFIDQIGCLVGVRRNLKDEEITDDDNEDKPQKNKLNEKGTANYFPGGKNVAAMFEQVKIISKLIKRRNYKDDIEEEWQTLAKVFDRLFFILFVIIFVLVTALIIAPARLQYEG